MKTILNIAYYKEEDWDRFLECIDDRESMHETWQEWYESYIKARNGLNVKGFKVKKIVVNIDELKQFCKDKGIKNDGKARSQFVSTKNK